MRVTSEYTKMPINQYQRRIVTLDDLISKMRAEKERIAGQIAQAKAAGTAAEEALAGELSERSRGAKTRELENAVKALAHTKQRLQVLEAKLVKAVKGKLRAQGQLEIAQKRAAKTAARKSAAKG